MTISLNAAWPYLCIGGYFVIVAGLLLANHRLHRRSTPTPYVDHEGTRYLEFYPPRIEATHTTDADWLFAWPVDVLSDDEIGLRCADIEAREGWVR